MLLEQRSGASSLNGRRRVGRPTGSKLVGIANRSRCGAGGGRMPQFEAHSTAPRGRAMTRRMGEISHACLYPLDSF